jgi:hypothetical protein
MKVYRDAHGNLINIGEWDERRVADEDGSIVVKNPLPTDAVESDEEVITGADGGRYLKTDYAKLRRAEYPDFREYLDGVVKGDQSQVQAYIDACQAVKAKYPKG